MFVPLITLIDLSFVAQELGSDCIRRNEDLMWGQEQAGVLPCQDIEGDCVCLHPARLTVPQNNCTRGRQGEGPTWVKCSRKCALKIKKMFCF